MCFYFKVGHGCWLLLPWLPAIRSSITMAFGIHCKRVTVFHKEGYHLYMPYMNLPKSCFTINTFFSTSCKKVQLANWLIFFHSSSVIQAAVKISIFQNHYNQILLSFYHSQYFKVSLCMCISYMYDAWIEEFVNVPCLLHLCFYINCIKITHGGHVYWACLSFGMFCKYVLYLNIN